MKIPYMRLVNLFVSIGIVGFTTVVFASETKPYEIIKSQSQVQNISAVMRNSTEVVLKSGGSKFGKLTAIDIKEQNLTLVLQNRDSELIPISQVEKIMFRNISPLVCGKPDCLGPLQGDISNWSKLPLANLRIQPDKNRLQIKLPCELAPNVCKKPVASYTVEELSFVDFNKVSLRVVIAR
jgi:hypothetical protein